MGTLVIGGNAVSAIQYVIWIPHIDTLIPIQKANVSHTKYMQTAIKKILV